MTTTPTHEPEARPEGYGDPRFALVAERQAPGPPLRVVDPDATVDAHESHVVATVTFDGKVIGAIRARTLSTGDDDPRFVAHGITVLDPNDDRTWGPNLRSTSIANTGATVFRGEPEPGDVAVDAIYRELREDAFGWVRYSPTGADLPTGLLPPFYTAVTEASERFGRPVVDGKLTGEPRTW